MGESEASFHNTKLCDYPSLMQWRSSGKLLSIHGIGVRTTPLEFKSLDTYPKSSSSIPWQSLGILKPACWRASPETPWRARPGGTANPLVFGRTSWAVILPFPLDRRLSTRFATSFLFFSCNLPSFATFDLKWIQLSVWVWPRNHNNRHLFHTSVNLLKYPLLDANDTVTQKKKFEKRNIFWKKFPEFSFEV